jgi:hypothetical protein
MTTQPKTFTHWDDVPTKWAASAEGHGIIAAGNTIEEAKAIAWNTFGNLHCEVVIRTNRNGRYVGPYRFEGEAWSDERGETY